MPGKARRIIDMDRLEKIPELLAPAGSFKALEAAVNAGADAVYLSGKEYGARKYADNFSPREMADAVDFAHMHGVKVYATVNTLIHDDELPDAAGYVTGLYSIGIDGIIVQDVGLARIIKNIVPDLPLHASTQTTIYSREGVLWAKKAGFEMVILARETSLSELDLILALDPKNRPAIEIFVHGALCYCFSGQCLLSSVIGGRSGNRGMCAQPCRKPYVLFGAGADSYGRSVDAERIPLDTRYLLSPRDLMLYPLLDEIAGRDIAALKIEGRMRSPEYVGIVVSAYRNALDHLKDGTWTPSREDMDDMSIVFSRGFTRGYPAGEKGALLMGRERPDNRGLFVGEVVSCNPSLGFFLVRPGTGYLPAKGDGIAIEDPRSGNISGFVLTEDGRDQQGLLRIGMAGLARTTGCRQGMRVFVTSSPRIGEKAVESARRFGIPLDISLDFPDDGPPVLTGTLHTRSGDIAVVHRADFIPEKARTAPLSISQIEVQMRKTADPVFEVRTCIIRYPGDLFVPLGELNRFRREFFAKAREAFLDQSRPGDKEKAAVAHRLRSFSFGEEAGGIRVADNAPSISVYADSVAAAASACESGCGILYFEPHVRDPDLILEELSQVIDSCRTSNALPVWKWPPLPPPDFIESARSIIDPLSRKGLSGIMAENLGLAEAVREKNPELRLYGGQGLNVFNHATALSLAPPYSCLTLSPELSGTRIRSLLASVAGKGLEFEVIVQGNLLAMVSRDDLLGTVLPGTGFSLDSFPLYGLKDRTGRIFPVDRDSMGRSRIWNSAETCLLDYLPSLVESGVSSLAIDSRGRGDAYAREMTAIYTEAIEFSVSGSERDKEVFGSLKRRLMCMTRGGITAGYFVRGLRK
jgi:putative protease